MSILNVRLPNAPKNSDEQLKKIKENISNTIKEIKSICIYDSLDEIKNSILLTKNYAEIIIEIIEEIDEQIKNYFHKIGGNISV